MNCLFKTQNFKAVEKTKRTSLSLIRIKTLLIKMVLGHNLRTKIQISFIAVIITFILMMVKFSKHI